MMMMTCYKEIDWHQLMSPTRHSIMIKNNIVAVLYIMIMILSDCLVVWDLPSKVPDYLLGCSLGDGW